MSCTNMPPELEAYADGELHDATAISAVVAHLSLCADCRAQVEGFKQLSASLQMNLPKYPASDLLRARMQTLLAQSNSAAAVTDSSALRGETVTSIEFARTAKSLRNWKIFALAASALFAVVSAHDFTARHAVAANPPSDASALVSQELINAHIRSLMSDHLVDVPSSDRHTVKPWFEGKINFSPSVFDFASDSFALAGGRLDYTTGHAVAAIVFHYGQHAINLFVWPSDSADIGVTSLSRDGYNIASWRRNHLQYSAVSTLNGGSLARFASLYVARDSLAGAVQR